MRGVIDLHHREMDSVLLDSRQPNVAAVAPGSRDDRAHGAGSHIFS